MICSKLPKAILAVALAMSFNPLAVGAAYADSPLVVQDVQLEDPQSQFSYTILGNGSLDAGHGRVTPEGSVKGVVVTDNETGAKYTITPGDGNPLGVYSDETTVGVIEGGAIRVKVEDPSVDYTSLVTYKDANGGDRVAILASEPLSRIDSPETTWERYNKDGVLYWASKTIWVRGVGVEKTVYESTGGALKANGAGGYKGYDRTHTSHYDYYDGNALNTIECEYKSGNGVVKKTFTGDDLRIVDGAVENFYTMEVTYPDRSVWYASEDGTGAAGLYDFETVSNVNDIALSTDGNGIPIYSSDKSLRVSVDGSGNITEVVDESGKAVKSKYKIFTVRFVDWDGALISSQQVVNGEDATAPANPKRPGYTFKKWAGSYKHVTSDATVKATYVKGSDKKANTLSVKAKTLKLEKSSKARTVKISKLFAVKGAKGKVTYAKVAKGSSKKLAVKGAKVTIAKNAKGNLKLKVKVKAAGNASYAAKAVAKTATVKIS